MIDSGVPRGQLSNNVTEQDNDDKGSNIGESHSNVYKPGNNDDESKNDQEMNKEKENENIVPMRVSPQEVQPASIMHDFTLVSLGEKAKIIQEKMHK